MRAARSWVLFAFVLVAALCVSAPLAGASTDSHLVFSDEFSGGLDTANWATETPWHTQYTTNELEYYDPADVSVTDGSLQLTSESRSMGGHNYTSGIVTSLPHAKFSYGYFEVRAKLPSGPGIWPAFWLTNDSTLEIDDLEVLGDKPGKAYMTLHENDSQIFQRSYNGPDFSGGYHTFGVDWQADHIKWYVDGVCRATYSGHVPSDPLWICLNTAVGGNWPGSPTSATKFPQTYAIDYVRVYDTMPGAAASTVQVASTSSATHARAAKRAAHTSAGSTAPTPQDVAPAPETVPTAPGASTVSDAVNRTSAPKPLTPDVAGTAPAQSTMLTPAEAGVTAPDVVPDSATPALALDSHLEHAPAHSVVSASTVACQRVDR